MAVYEPEPYGMSAREAAAGWVPGADAAEHPLPRSSGATSPVLVRAALEDALRPALRHRPCVVAFSGGRDSSAVLAVAVSVARREGLPTPTVVSYRYPGVRGTDESAWQEMVVRHLGIADWARLELGTEGELLGSAARASLQRHGLLWPAPVHLKGPKVAPARGGAYVTGEGGDEVLGFPRIAPWVALREGTTPLSRASLGELARAAPLPPSVRRHLLRRRLRWLVRGRSWLQPDVARWLVESQVDDDLAQPLRLTANLSWLLRRRALTASMRNMQVIADEQEVQCVHPLLDHTFAVRLSGLAGPWSWPGRTRMMELVFGDLLPAAVLQRETKAFFNFAMCGPETRAFMDGWDGTGLDPALVDAAALKAQWRDGMPHGGSFQLAQAAWLAQHGGPRHPIMG